MDSVLSVVIELAGFDAYVQAVLRGWQWAGRERVVRACRSRSSVARTGPARMMSREPCFAKSACKLVSD